ncbi:hypothetical protein C8R45DRAFT_1174491 [Mycena sanguinolenta]|nr:hypothetical protein C8R45DRAFT_1174491 [Mycena sanguinolenta]
MRPARLDNTVCSEYLTGNPGVSLIEGAANGDGEKRLEIAIRRLSGCGGFLKKIDRGLSVLETQTTKTQLTTFLMSFSRVVVRSTPPSLAGSPAFIALQIAVLLRRSGTQYDLDVRNSPRYRVFRHLWRAMDKRDEGMAVEERKRHAKVAKAPNAYSAPPKDAALKGPAKPRCSAAGESALQRSNHRIAPKIVRKRSNAWCCTVVCEIDIRQDWPAHKKICKPGSTNTISADNGQVMALNIDEDSALLDNEISEGDVERIIELPHPNIPGEKLRVVSRHLSPVFLRHLRGSMSTAGANATGTE